MIFDAIPTELKEHIFTYIPPNDWINIIQVSNEWLALILGSIKKVKARHILILDHLAEFINQQKKTNYTWVSLLAMMPRLEHLECFENTEAFCTGVSPICHQLKVLDCRPREVESFDWIKLDISLQNLVVLHWNGISAGQVFPLNWFAYLPKLGKLTLTYVKINSEWKNKIPKSVKYILLDRVKFCEEYECSISDVCEDSSTLETFCVHNCSLSISASFQFFNKTPHLKNLELDYINKDATALAIAYAVRKCPGLINVYANGVLITDNWRRVLPKNIKYLYFSSMKLLPLPNIRSEFSFDWLFQNYDGLQSLEVLRQSWTEFDPQKFYSTKSLEKLVLHNQFVQFVKLEQYNEPIEPFSEICVRMIRGSHLVHVELFQPVIDESWRHIFPPTLERLKLERFYLSKEAKFDFLPQFICENPSNLEFLSLNYFHGGLPGMNLDAFSGMNKLQELHLLYSSISENCLQSILTHCSALTDLVLHELQYGALTNVPRNLVLPNLRKLNVKKAVVQPSLLLQHFPKLRNVDITIVPPEECFADIMNVLQLAEVVEIKIGGLSLHLLHSLVENIDDTKFKYFCLSVVRCKEFSFHLTNSILDAFRKVYRFPFRVKKSVLWTRNYPTSPLLRKHVSTIPSNMDELSKRYHEIMALRYEEWDYDNDSDDDSNEEDDDDNGDDDHDANDDDSYDDDESDDDDVDGDNDDDNDDEDV